MLNVFVCGHQPECFTNLILKPWLTPVNLNALDIGKYQDNQLAEHRLLIADPPTDAEYVGLATASWSQKYPQSLQLHQLDRLQLQPNVIYAPRPAPPNWAFLSKLWHLGLERYLNELVEVSGLKAEGPSLWGNTFICHQDTYRRFLVRWRSLFDHFFDKYGTNIEIDSPDPPRRAGYFYERISVLIFANLGLPIQSLEPTPQTVIKLPRKIIR